MTKVIDRIKKLGYKNVTIAVDENEPDNLRLYQRLGFIRKVKDCYYDPCNVDEWMKSKPCGKIYLLEKEL